MVANLTNDAQVSLTQVKIAHIPDIFSLMFRSGFRGFGKLESKK